MSLCCTQKAIPMASGGRLVASKVQKVVDLRVKLLSWQHCSISTCQLVRLFGITSIAQVPDYYEIIKTPMDLSTIMSKIDLHQYQTCAEFLADIDLICSNALEYNPADSTAGTFYSVLSNHQIILLCCCCYYWVSTQFFLLVFIHWHPSSCCCCCCCCCC